MDGFECAAQAKMLAFFSESATFMRVRKKFWLVPVIVTVLVFGVLIVLTQGSAIATFVYTLF